MWLCAAFWSFGPKFQEKIMTPKVKKHMIQSYYPIISMYYIPICIKYYHVLPYIFPKTNQAIFVIVRSLTRLDVGT